MEKQVISIVEEYISNSLDFQVIDFKDSSKIVIRLLDKVIQEIIIKK